MHIHYLVDGPVKRDPGGWTSPLASLRYRVLLPATELSRQGIRIQLNYARAPAAEHERALVESSHTVDVLCVSKCFYPPALSILQSYARAGVPIVADFCDDHFQNPDIGPMQHAIASAARRIVVSTPTMATAVRQATGRDVVVIDDPFEGPPGQAKFSPRAHTLNLLWFGHPSNLDTLEPMFQQLAHWMANDPQSHGRQVVITLVTQIDQPLRDYVVRLQRAFPRPITLNLTAWSPNATWSALTEADAVLLPSRPSQAKAVKSANRLVECLRAGRLAITHPVPSYLSLGEYAYIDADLGHGLSEALANASGAEARVENGQAWAIANASPAQCARRWRDVFEAAGRGDAPELTPRVEPLRLNLGCGDKILPGYVNVDVALSRNNRSPDVICDLHALTPFASGSADEILSVHVIEHFWRWEVVDILREWVRVLRPGGRMIIECPNLITACEELLKDPAGRAGPGREGQRTMWVFYGDPSWRDPLMTHRWLYTPDSLAQVMREAGLINICREPAQFKLKDPRDMRLVGVAPARVA